MVARDERFDDLLASGDVSADPERDYTAHVEVEGLPAGRQVFYTFEVLTTEGPTRSAVGRARTLAEDPALVRIGVACCASLAHGWLHGYRFLAERDLDLVLHLGDAIYEFATGQYGSLRPYDPPHACVTLDDYRRRHAQYRSEPEAQLFRGAHAVCALWDDHEFVNDAFQDGSYFHDPVLGSYLERREAARRAFFEWTPMRRAHGPDRIYRSLSFGSLLNLVLADGRMDGRSYQPFDEIERLDPSRRMISPEQEAWLLAELSRDARYRVMAQQVLFAHHPEVGAWDAWEGYAAQRRRILSALAAGPNGTFLAIAGDSHASWASELPIDPFDPAQYEPLTGRGSLGVEFGVPGISSPNLDPRDAPSEEARIVREGPQHRYTEQSSRGFLIVELDERSARAQHVFVDGVESPTTGRERMGPMHEVLAGTSILVR
jgi:alkaline phosphatase D